MNIYKRHRFPPDIISYAVRLYHRFNLSLRDIEDLLAERRISVSHESIRLWGIKFGLWRFKSTVQAQCFLGVHSAVFNLFNLGCHIVRARDYRDLRHRAFVSWIKVTAG